MAPALTANHMPFIAAYNSASALFAQGMRTPCFILQNVDDLTHAAHPATPVAWQ